MIKKDSLMRMAEVRGEWCVSVYMPINRADAKKNRIRLKKLMFEAEKKLLGLEMEPFKVARLLGPIEMFLDNNDFWENRNEGFAAFFTPNSFAWFSMQYQFNDLVVVTDRFHLKPLMRNAAQSRGFHLLSLKDEQINFYEASEIGINEVFLKGIPRQLNLALDAEKDENLPHEEFEDGKKSKILEAFRKVDKALTEYLKDDEAPLMLAGNSDLQAVYQQANTYAHILDQGLTADAGDLTPKQLLQKALPVVKPVFRNRRENATEIYQRKIGTHLASDNLAKIFKAARDGKIETLFVPIGVQKWGKFDRQTDELQIHQSAEPGDKDLLCVASTRTLLNGGEVFVVLPEQMPGESSIAAVMRGQM